MKFAVIVFPGSNCDYDAYYVINKHLNCKVDFVWHKDSNLDSYDCIVIPGGFSYGDYLRAGAIARFSKIMNEVKIQSQKGKFIIGICNGFQILVESGLLPGALITNESTSFISKNIELNVINNKTQFTNKFENNQIIFKYSNNPNGSKCDIAGIVNKEKNILGMMPHPERASDKLLGSSDGFNIFKSIISQIS